MIEEYDTFRDRSQHPRRKTLADYVRPPEVMLNYNPELARGVTRILFTHQGSRTLLLNVGGGPRRYSDQEVTLNIRPFFNVDLIGDAQDIPVEDETFDSVICNAVLEHVRDPERVVGEMARVLKPGGYIYAEVPFMFFFHGYPNDYRRFTREGIKRLFAGLEDMQVSLTHGPVSVILQSLNILVRICIPPGRTQMRRLASGLFRWTMFPLKYLDIILKKNPESALLAGGFAVLARKPVGTPVPEDTGGSL